MRSACAGDLGVVLDRLHERDRVGAARGLAAVTGDEAGERVGGGGLVEPHGLLLVAEHGKRGHEIGGARTSASASSRSRTSFEFAGVDMTTAGRPGE